MPRNSDGSNSYNQDSSTPSVKKVDEEMQKVEKAFFEVSKEIEATDGYKDGLNAYYAEGRKSYFRKRHPSWYPERHQTATERRTKEDSRQGSGAEGTE